MANKRVIHVVEDDEPMRDSLVELLEEAGYCDRTWLRGQRRAHAGHGWSHLAATPSGERLGIAANADDWSRRYIDGGVGNEGGRGRFSGKADALLTAVGAALRLRSSDANEDAEAARRRLLKLTAREYEVFKHLVTGKSNKEAAAKLGISPRTVEFHRAHIMEKTAAKGLPELVRLWLTAKPQSAK